MSGLPPTFQVATTRREAKSITEIVPARRFVTYTFLVSRLIAMPCAPLPVGMNVRTFIVSGSTTETPPRPWLATKKTLPSGESFTSTGSPPTFIVPTTFMVFTSTFTTVPSNSHPIIRYDPSAEKSR